MTSPMYIAEVSPARIRGRMVSLNQLAIVFGMLAVYFVNFAIANAGDEIAFRYPVPPAPPPGWKRDFIWESDGWTHDGDLNTRYGNRVLPLPAHGVNSDERPPTRLKDDPVFRRFPMDWQTFHTRLVSDEEFGRGLRGFRR